MEYLPKEGKFVIVWYSNESLYPNSYKWVEDTLYGFDEESCYWEEATEENGWFFDDMDKAIVITKDNFK